MIDFIKIKSAFDFEETMKKVLDFLNSRKVLVFTIIDHKKNAERVNMFLNKESLILFGTPEVGTNLMIENPDSGFELPLRILIYEKDGSVNIVLPDIDKTAQRFSLTDSSESLKKMKNLMGDLIANFNM
ncbi:DUF302 domain-containing protein [Caldiplasma sukawensis]